MSEKVYQESQFLLVCQGSELLTQSYKEQMQKFAPAMAKACAAYLFSRLETFSQLKEQLEEVSCTLTFVDSDEIQQINSEYREKDKVTDVLSFPVLDNPRSEIEEVLPVLELGDIYICVSKCEEQADEFNLSFWEEAAHLYFHGFLHLLGFDHEVSEEEEVLMQKHEDELLSQLSQFLKL